MKSNRMFYAAVGLSLLFPGCLSNCKMVTKPANPYLQPMVVPLESGAVSASNGQADPLAEKQWATTKLGLKDVWENPNYQGARRVTVALIGSGVDYNHEDLRPNILVNLKEAQSKNPGDPNPIDDTDKDHNGYVGDIVGYDFVEGHGLPYDRIGSGTAAAGIIGAVHDNGKGVKGVLAKVSMIPIKYIGPNGTAQLPDLVASLNYALNARPDVIYLHLANIAFTPASAAKGKIDVGAIEKNALGDVLRKLNDKNIPVIVGAGNTGADLGQSHSIAREMSKYENVVIVTSVDENDNRPFIANYGREIVTTSAPGTRILTTLPGNRYGEVTGTYAAAAYVAGAVALGISVHYGQVPVAGDKATAAGNKTSILRTLLKAEASDPLSQDRQQETLGGNRLNIAKFMKALE